MIANANTPRADQAVDVTNQIQNLSADQIMARITVDNFQAFLPILEKAFDLVVNRDHWKYPIDCRRSRAEIEAAGGQAVVEAAVIWYTGSRPRFSHVGNAHYAIRAAGYYATCGA